MNEIGFHVYEQSNALVNMLKEKYDKVDSYNVEKVMKKCRRVSKLEEMSRKSTKIVFATYNSNKQLV